MSQQTRVGKSLVRPDPSLLRYVVEKGSITVDGISLTVVDPLDDGFTVAVIPHTQAVTTLGTKGPGDRVNLEVDVLLFGVLCATAIPTPLDRMAAETTIVCNNRLIILLS